MGRVCHITCPEHAAAYLAGSVKNTHADNDSRRTRRILGRSNGSGPSIRRIARLPRAGHCAARQTLVIDGAGGRLARRGGRADGRSFRACRGPCRSDCSRRATSARGYFCAGTARRAAAQEPAGLRVDYEGRIRPPPDHRSRVRWGPHYDPGRTRVQLQRLRDLRATSGEAGRAQRTERHSAAAPLVLERDGAVLAGLR